MTEKVGILRYLKGGITIKEMDEMSYEDYRILAHTVEYLARVEKEEIERSRKEGKSRTGKYRK